MITLLNIITCIWVKVITFIAMGSMQATAHGKLRDLQPHAHKKYFFVPNIRENT